MHSKKLKDRQIHLQADRQDYIRNELKIHFMHFYNLFDYGFQLDVTKRDTLKPLNTKPACS